MTEEDFVRGNECKHSHIHKKRRPFISSGMHKDGAWLAGLRANRERVCL